MYNSIYPGYVNYYPGLNKKQIEQKQDEENNSRRSQNAENPFNSEAKNQPSRNIEPARPALHSNFSPNITFPNGEKAAIDYTKKQINIVQVLSDFRNTASAIGAPDDIKTEVETYLNLVQGQSIKDNPNVQIIQSNLKNASQVLDEYITRTLKKPSKVVESWVDALFLQQIDYKSPVEEKAEKEQIQEETSAENTEIIEEEKQNERKNNFYVPLDKHLKSMFLQAKKYSAIDKKEKALSAFQDVAEYAMETGDKQAVAIAYYEQGKIYDDFNRPEDALYSYNMAIADTQDNNIKARAHISMGQIYDDYVNFEPAVNHYCAAVTFAGESDNLNLQTKALSNLAKIHANKYDKDNSYLFMDLANRMAKETKNNRTKGLTFASSANCCNKLNEKSKALKLYRESAQAFADGSYYDGLANDFVKAGDIMLQYGNKAKAKKLFYKAFIALQKCDNPELKQEVTDKITSL